MPLPAELADLEASYAAILNQVDNGTLQPAQALEAAGHLGVFDSNGSHWTVSLETEPPNTQFLCAQPGAAPMPADPAAFAPTPGFSAPATPPGAENWYSTPPDDPVTPLPGQQPSVEHPYEPAHTIDIAPPGQQQPSARRNGIAGLIPSRTAAGADSGGIGALLQGRGRTIAVVVIAVVVVIVARACLSDSGGPATPEAAAPTTIELTCPDLTAEVTGADGDTATLLGCLDGSADAASDDHGPQIAIIGVTSTDGAIAFDPAKKTTRADALATAGGLYRFAGGRPAADSVDADYTGVPEALLADVTIAVDQGFVQPANLNPTGQATRGMLAVVVARSLAAAEGTDPTGSSAAADADTATEAEANAHGYLAARGIITDPDAAFGFSDPATAADWVQIAGRAAHWVKNPTEPAAAPAPDPAKPDTLDGDTIDTALTALTSGDTALTAGIVDGADSDSNDTRLLTASYAGLDATGLQLTSGPAKVDGKAATSDLTVTDSDGATVGTAKARWTLTADGWKFADWPEISAS